MCSGGDYFKKKLSENQNKKNVKKLLTFFEVRDNLYLAAEKAANNLRKDRKRSKRDCEKS